MYRKAGDNVIEILNVNKSFKNTDVLTDVNLTIQDNEVFGLVGPSGVGKSTLLNCLIGLEKYQSGSICIDGVRLEELNELEIRKFRKNMGMIFQNFSQDKLKNRPSELSGGQKQRVAIARALTMNPRYLLCDECTSSLDPKSTSSILELLKSLQEQFQITIIVVTHEMAVVQNLCNKMAILESGKVSLSGDVQEIFKEKPEQLRTLLGEDERMVSITLDVAELAKVKEYLDTQGTNYKITGGY